MFSAMTARPIQNAENMESLLLIVVHLQYNIYVFNIQTMFPMYVSLHALHDSL